MPPGVASAGQPMSGTLRLTSQYAGSDPAAQSAVTVIKKPVPVVVVVMLTPSRENTVAALYKWFSDHAVRTAALGSPSSRAPFCTTTTYKWEPSKWYTSPSLARTSSTDATWVYAWLHSFTLGSQLEWVVAVTVNVVPAGYDRATNNCCFSDGSCTGDAVNSFGAPSLCHTYHPPTS